MIPHSTEPSNRPSVKSYEGNAHDNVPHNSPRLPLAEPPPKGPGKSDTKRCHETPYTILLFGRGFGGGEGGSLSSVCERPTVTPSDKRARSSPLRQRAGLFILHASCTAPVRNPPRKCRAQGGSCCEQAAYPGGDPPGLRGEQEHDEDGRRHHQLAPHHQQPADLPIRTPIEGGEPAPKRSTKDVALK